MQFHYLEIVSDDIEATCALYANIFAVNFSEDDPNLGLARTATLENGSMQGDRAPMSESEGPVVRPYWLVDNIETSITAATDSGAEVALGTNEIDAYGTFAILIQDGIQTGLWQV